jgi:hypothetical protein
MKYFIDTEFKEKPNIIDLISIGIVSEDNREYYTICNDFDIKDAWKSYQFKTEMRDAGMRKVEVKEYWLRENVLKSIFKELLLKFKGEEYKANQYGCSIHKTNLKFTKKNFTKLIKKYGKNKRQIVSEIVEFIYPNCQDDNLTGLSSIELAKKYECNDKKLNPEFYAYYADYDWVVFCWLFGRMIDLPKGFPMYCKDLKQMMDDKRLTKDNFNIKKLIPQENEHNALDDARWNLKLYNLLIK